MYTVKLRRIGGSSMLAVLPTLLDLLGLGAGSRANLSIETGLTIVATQNRPAYSLDELLAQCDEWAPADASVREWLDAEPVGNELMRCGGERFGSLPSIRLLSMNNTGLVPS